jgi:hypothetical protein
MYYTYSRHRSRDAAESALEEYFATGEVSDGEWPRIKYERSRGWLVQFYDWTYPTFEAPTR